MNLKKIYPFLLLVILHLILLTQLRFTVWPEMVLYPYLMLNDFSLYKDIINPYFPLLSIITFGFFKLFGLSILNLKLFTWLIILITDGVIIYTAKHFSKKRSNQLVSLFTFILLQIYFGGNGLWFELMLSPFILLSLTLVYFYPSSIKKMSLVGIFLGMAILIKQNSILFLIPILLNLIWQKQMRSFRSLISTTLLVLGLCVFFLNYYQVWDDFLTWAVILPLSLTKQNGFVSLPALHQYLLILFPLITLIPFLVDKKNKSFQKLFWLIAFLTALLFTFPKYENFHLQVLAAFSSIFAPMLSRKYLFGFVTIVIILVGSFFVKNYHQEDRFIDSGMLQLAQKIKDYPSVYILNGPELSYYFAGKLPPKPWATNFPWYFEVNNFEKRFTNAEIQQTKYVVIGDPVGGDTYDLGNYLPAGLINYIQYNYSQLERFENYTIWQRKKLTSP